MQCPVCGKEIKEFYADVVYKQAGQSYMVGPDYIEIIDEDVWESEEERCYCPHCDSVFDISIAEGQDLLKGEAILINMERCQPKEIKVRVSNWIEKVLVVRFNNKLYFARPKYDKRLVHHNKPFEMMLFHERFVFDAKLGERLNPDEFPIITEDALRLDIECD